MTDNKYYIVRCDRAGVFAGNIKYREGREVTMTNVRRLWMWAGALTLSDLALCGTTAPGDCKFTTPIDEIVLLEAIELIPCTAQAEASIQGVPVWTLQ